MIERPNSFDWRVNPNTVNPKTISGFAAEFLVSLTDRLRGNLPLASTARSYIREDGVTREIKKFSTGFPFAVPVDVRQRDNRERDEEFTMGIDNAAFAVAGSGSEAREIVAQYLEEKKSGSRNPHPHLPCDQALALIVADPGRSVVLEKRDGSEESIRRIMMMENGSETLLCFQSVIGQELRSSRIIPSITIWHFPKDRRQKLFVSTIVENRFFMGAEKYEDNRLLVNRKELDPVFFRVAVSMMEELNIEADEIYAKGPECRWISG